VFVRALMFRNKVLHVMCIAVLLIQYSLGYLAASSSRAQHCSTYKHAPVMSKFMSGPKGVHITGVHCIMFICLFLFCF